MAELKHIGFPGRLVIVGFGSIGQGVLPLLLRHIDVRPDQITIVSAEPRGRNAGHPLTAARVGRVPSWSPTSGSGALFVSSPRSLAGGGQPVAALGQVQRVGVGGTARAGNRVGG